MSLYTEGRTGEMVRKLRTYLRDATESLSEARRAFCWKLHCISGRDEGEVMRWWVLLVWCVLRPVTIIEMLAARCLCLWRHEIRIGKMRISMQLISMLDTSPTPGPWFRVIRREDGVITLEQKQETA